MENPMQDLDQYPEFRAYIDPEATDVTVEPLGDDLFLVTMRGEDGGQLLIKRDGDRVEIVASDNVIQMDDLLAPPPACVGECTPGQYASVAQAIVDKVDNFSTAAGPDHGNLACLWAVRHIVHDVLGFWITQSDGTADFYPQLVNCFGKDRADVSVPAGGIVISPTSGPDIGHIGLLGSGRGDGRLIYSNSSSAAMWEQNYTIQKWRERYRDRKGLPVYFFPLPRFNA